MRNLTYLVATTLDGFIAGPDGSDPSAPGGFWPITPEYVEHLVRHYPETLPGPARAAMGISGEGIHFDTVLEGRRSYELGLRVGVTDAYPHLRHLVFSRTLAQSPAPTVEIVRTDPVARVRALKAEPGGGIWLLGGGEIAACLSAEVDQLVLKVAPVTIGSGVPVFGRRAEFEPRYSELTDRAEIPTGASFLTYHRAGT